MSSGMPSGIFQSKEQMIMQRVWIDNQGLCIPGVWAEEVRHASQNADSRSACPFLH